VPMKRAFLSISLLLSLVSFSAAADMPVLLPKSFAGWTQSGPATIVNDPAQADTAYPGVLKEYGFVASETASYVREDGRRLTVKAAKFNDASGAYGAFTFYRQPAMKTEQIGSKAASANERILFFRDNVLVDADFARLTGMSAAELRELAGMLPAATGNAANLPDLPNYLPKEHAVENSAKYILGPQALVATRSPLTAEQVDFSHDPEILSQEYSPAGGPATLTIIAYPTPQIAAERLRVLDGAAHSAPNPMLVRRSGPLLAVVTGVVGNSDAKDLLNSVNYEAQVTWNEATSVSKRDNIGNLILGIFALIGIILLISVIFGVFFGGFRIVMRRFFPEILFDRPEQVEIIQLHLKSKKDG